MERKTSGRSKKTAKKAGAKKAGAKKKAVTKKTGSKPVLLAGGNPQIPKGDGDAPVRAYLAAMPGWKRDVGCRFDALVVLTVPDVVKAVKWNSPFYGLEGRGWFLNVHCFTKAVRVTFFQGASLRPLPPGSFKDPNARSVDLTEDGSFDEEQLASWIRQAADLPGWMP